MTDCKRVWVWLNCTPRPHNTFQHHLQDYITASDDFYGKLHAQLANRVTQPIFRTIL
jgi:hypothetical protein